MGKKEELIQQEAQQIRETIALNPNINNLEQALDQLKTQTTTKTKELESASWATVIETGNYSAEVLALLHKKRIHETIGIIKTDPMIEIGKKTGGTVEGFQANKSAKEGESSDKAKLGYTWQVKGQNNLSELICEYIGTNIQNELLKVEETSPKVRLQAQENNINFMSKFLGNNFQTLDDIEKKNPGSDKFSPLNESHGFGRVVFALGATGNIDPNSGNIATIDKDKRKLVANIDLGRALSFYGTVSHGNVLSGNLESAENFQNLLTQEFKYPAHLLQSMDYAGELYQSTSKDFNEDNIKLTIKLSMDNVKEAFKTAYGEEQGPMMLLETLSSTEPNNTLNIRERLGLGFRDKEINPKMFEDRIIENIKIRQREFEEIAKAEMKEIFPQHAEEALEAYSQAMSKDGINYSAFITKLSELEIDFSNSEHFNLAEAQNRTNNDFKNALIAHNGISQGIKLAMAPDNIINIRDRDGFTPLHNAVMDGDLNKVTALINNKLLDLNCISPSNRYSALHLAIANENSEIAIALINAGANLDLESKFSGTPREMADGMEEVVDAIKKSQKLRVKIPLSNEYDVNNTAPNSSPTTIARSPSGGLYK
jgi:hypothetical protein